MSMVSAGQYCFLVQEITIRLKVSRYHLIMVVTYEHHLRRSPSINPTLDRCIVFAEMLRWLFIAVYYT